ncbi:MAG: FkbM family methyltransferase [Ignavibacteriales bacterium]|nr:FkbM family methyltransferase [Ignavibacteriales bacterium]
MVYQYSTIDNSDGATKIKEAYLRQLSVTEKKANASRLYRLLKNPVKYIIAILFRKIIYPWSKKILLRPADVFFGMKMQIALPSSTDIYLTGGKSDDSEIRLAKFLIRNLNKGDHFLDIGAHFGYFTLLTSKLVGMEGKIIGYEPARNNFTILHVNCQSSANIWIHNEAISDYIGLLTFYEFPILYSEYNSADIHQFKSASWFRDVQAERIEVPATTIDAVTSNDRFVPKIIKIDVEGSEFKVVQGGISYISNKSPLVAMEYLSSNRQNNAHQNAVQFLKEKNYSSHIIMKDGDLKLIDNLDMYFEQNGIESDNIIFVKK